jgi:hypothetical protein
MICFINLIGQNENNIWLLPIANLKVNLISDPPEITNEVNNFVGFLSGHSVVNNELGELLFYTEGNSIWDNKHQLVEGTISFFGEFNNGVQKSAVIKSKDERKYYVFALQGLARGNGELYFREIIVNNHTTEVFSPTNSLTKIGDNFTTGMTIVPHPCYGNWIILHERNNNNYISYHFYEGKIINKVISTIGSIIDQHRVSFAFSNQLSILASMHFYTNLTEFFKFDSLTGKIISQPIEFFDSPYLGSFSPNGKLFYYFGSCGRTIDSLCIKQFDFTDFNSQKINESFYGENLPASLLERTQTARTSSIQLGPHNRLYFSSAGIENSIGIIHNPDEKGKACNFEAEAIIISDRFVIRQIPTVISFSKPRLDIFSFSDTITCRLNELVITPTTSFDSLVWNDGSKLGELKVDKGGLYSLKLYKDGCEYLDTIQVTDQIVQKEEKVTVCHGDDFMYKNVSYAPGATIIDTLRGNQCDTLLKIEVLTKEINELTDSVKLCHGDTYAHSDGKIYQPGDIIQEQVQGISNSCDTLKTLMIIGVEIPIIKITGDSLVCYGQNAKISLSDHKQYMWSNGSIEQNVDLKPGKYTVKVYDDEACQITKNINIIELPEWVLSVPDTVRIEVGGIPTIELPEASNRIANWDISPDDGRIKYDTNKLIIDSVSESSNYTLFFSDTNDCSIERNLYIQVIRSVINKIYTNVLRKSASQSENSIWQIPMEDNQRLIEASIYNRWGNKVFSAKQSDDFWNVNNVVADVYVFRLEIEDERGKRRVNLGSILVVE